MRVLIKLLTIGATISSTAAFAETEWVETYKSMMGDELASQTTVPVAEAIQKLIAKVEKLGEAYGKRKVPVIQARFAIGKNNKETLANALRFQEEDIRFADELQHEQQLVESDQLLLKNLDTYTDGAQVTLSKVAQILNYAAPIQAMDYYQLSMVDAEDLRDAISQAASRVDSYGRDLSTAIQNDSRRYDNLRGIITSLSQHPNPRGCKFTQTKSSKSCEQQWLDTLDVGSGLGPARGNSGGGGNGGVAQ